MLMQLLYPVEYVPESVIEILIDLTQGIPLYLEEVATALKHNGAGGGRDLRLRANITSLLGLLAAENEEIEVAEKHLLEAQSLMSKGYAPKIERRVVLQRIVDFYLDQSRSTEAQKYQDLLDQLSR